MIKKFLIIMSLISTFPGVVLIPSTMTGGGVAEVGVAWAEGGDG